MSLAVDYTGGTTLIASSTAPTVHSHNVAGAPLVAESFRYGILKSRVDVGLTGDTNTSTDVYYAIAIPIYTIVLRVWIQTVEIELTGITGTFQIGDSSAATVYMNTATIPSLILGGVISALAADTGAANVIAGKFYPAADYIKLLVGTAALINGVYDVHALVINTGTQV